MWKRTQSFYVLHMFLVLRRQSLVSTSEFSLCSQVLYFLCRLDTVNERVGAYGTTKVLLQNWILYNNASPELTTEMYKNIQKEFLIFLQHGWGQHNRARF